MRYKLHSSRQMQVYIKEKNQFCPIKEMSYDFLLSYSSQAYSRPESFSVSSTYPLTIIFLGDIHEGIITPGSILTQWFLL